MLEKSLQKTQKRHSLSVFAKCILKRKFTPYFYLKPRLKIPFK